MRARRDCMLATASRVCACAASGLCLLMAAFLVAQSAPAIRSVGLPRFLSDASWHPTPTADGAFSLIASAVGTGVVALLAVALAAPVAVMAALGATFVFPRTVRWALDLGVGVMAGLPSVVLGLWGLTVLVPWVAELRPPGTCVLGASMVLAAMIAPTMYVAAKSAFVAVSHASLAAAAALGLSRWATVRSVVAPVAGRAVIVGVALGVMRALGETMIVVMLAGNVAVLPGSLLDPVRSLTANVALEMGYASGMHRAALFVGATVLLLGSLATVMLVRRWTAELNHA